MFVLLGALGGCWRWGFHTKQSSSNDRFVFKTLFIICSEAGMGTIKLGRFGRSSFFLFESTEHGLGKSQLFKKRSVSGNGSKLPSAPRLLRRGCVL